MMDMIYDNEDNNRGQEIGRCGKSAKARRCEGVKGAEGAKGAKGEKGVKRKRASSGESSARGVEQVTVEQEKEICYAIKEIAEKRKSG